MTDGQSAHAFLSSGPGCNQNGIERVSSPTSHDQGSRYRARATIVYPLWYIELCNPDHHAEILHRTAGTTYAASCSRSVTLPPTARLGLCSLSLLPLRYGNGVIVVICLSCGSAFRVAVVIIAGAADGDSSREAAAEINVDTRHSRVTGSTQHVRARVRLPPAAFVAV